LHCVLVVWAVIKSDLALILSRLLLTWHCSALAMSVTSVLTAADQLIMNWIPSRAKQNIVWSKSVLSYCCTQLIVLFFQFSRKWSLLLLSNQDNVNLRHELSNVSFINYSDGNTLQWKALSFMALMLWHLCFWHLCFILTFL